MTAPVDEVRRDALPLRDVVDLDQPSVLDERYDAFLFCDRTTAVRPLPG